MADKSRCDLCDRAFKDSEGLASHNAAKHPELVPMERKPLPIKKIRNWGIFIVVLSLIGFGIFSLMSSSANAQELPPTDMVGHIEKSPTSHILKEQMDIRVQKHMLEHVDGVDGAQGGIILNYDCENFECDPELIENLESFSNKYDNVYVAPFSMPVKIAITKLGRIETYEEYDPIKIETFITGIIPKSSP